MVAPLRRCGDCENNFKLFRGSGIYIPVQRMLAFLTAIPVCAFAPATGAAHTEARLVLSATTARPGDAVTAAVHLKMDPGWHTY